MTDQNQTPPQPPAQTPPPPEPSKSGSSTILIIGIVVIMLIALGAILYLILGGSGSETASPPPEAVVPTPPEITLPTPAPGTPLATALTVINLRSGPGTSYASYGIAQKGSQGEVIGISEDSQWWVVKLPTSVVGTGQGWVSADWVSVANAGGVPVIPAP
jgi:hypothetical protein